MGLKYSLLNCRRHSLLNEDDVMIAGEESYPPWTDTARKMWIEVNSYMQRNQPFWEEMLTHIRQVDKWL